MASSVSRGRLEWVGLAILVLVALAGIVATQFPGPAALAVVPSAVMVACVAGVTLGWTRTWGWVVGVTVVATEMSVVASIAVFRANALYPHGQTDAVLQTAYLCSGVDLLAGMVLIAWVIRKAPSAKRAAVVVILVAAGGAGAWALPFLDPFTPAYVLLSITVEALRSLVAVGVGVHLRSVDALRIRAVADARRAQRLDLARDLHDFVAHDVSGIVAQAQAAQLIISHDSGVALTALKRIEQAGLKALASMDNTVHMLHDTTTPDAAIRTPLPNLEARDSRSYAEVQSRLVDVGRSRRCP
jgi:signal transduction histidine kinase